MTPQNTGDSLPLTPLLADLFPKRREMTWHDQLVWLLHLGAAMEHALMVQYLYAAYSLGGKQVPPEHRVKVKEWQESILAVAREEMGHLITVQNVLTFLGAGFCLNRDQFPWAVEWFDIEPFCMGSLACYVNAEMPEAEDFPERKEIEDLVKKHLKKDAVPVHPVAAIYRQIMTLLADTERIPESALQPQTYSLQAFWDEWGRGYKPAPRPLDAAGNLVDATAEVEKQGQFDSHVLIFRVATRTEALAALDAISLQGEGVEDSKEEGEWTHFRRFIKIFREFKEIQSSDWSPAARAADQSEHQRGSECALSRRLHLLRSHAQLGSVVECPLLDALPVSGAYFPDRSRRSAERTERARHAHAPGFRRDVPTKDIVG